MNQLTVYLVALAIFVSIDLVWLGFVAKSFYSAEIGGLLAEQMNLPAAVLFYAIYAVGLMVFAVQPGLTSGGWFRAAMLGGLFGFVAYATYDLSNLATLRGWSTKLAIVDMVWGAVLSGLTAAITVLIAERLFARGTI
jgi:uncharacterized membrane protein